MIKLINKSDNGDTLEFLANNPLLLSYCDLVESKKSGKATLKFNTKAHEVIYNDEPIEKNGVISAPTTPKEKFKIYALTFGGWLPLSFVDNSIVLVDKNIIEHMRNLNNNPSNKELQSQAWWMEMSQSSDIVLNPLLYAFEDYRMKLPSFMEFKESFEYASAVIATYSDRLRLVKFDDESFEAAYSIIQILSATIDSEIKFLMQTAPLVAKQHKAQEFSMIEQEINQCVKDNKLTENSLAYLLVMGCLYENGNHARKVLKPDELYTEKDAYNAIMDLTHLKVLILSRRLPEEKMFFCTDDYPLAALWLSLNPHDFVVRNGSINYKVDTSRLLAKKDSALEVE